MTNETNKTEEKEPEFGVVYQDVKGKLESAYVKTRFDMAMEKLRSKGYRIITLSENAKLRMQEGEDAFISQHGNWTAEDFIYLPGSYDNKPVYITKKLLITQNAEKATECHRCYEEFCLSPEQVDYALEDAVQVKDTVIPTNRFGEDELTSFCFGKQAKAYGKFLKNAGLDKIEIYLDKHIWKPFARKVWFSGVCDRSGLCGNLTNLGSRNFETRGIREKAQ